ncbi:mini-circle protein [Blastococcus sp. TBT05-19]|uniref:mycothiol transferase n=1 Tax=Blastococcus sp. TBT05-19 TaxID=2250581 RepID=UPI000DEB370D|nr:DUF664 domain-containing protein [Blastococcus sp. TBT05-19]RBY90088.1 mini-circle protein [Blastococcus sp. TBT05-19]
MTAEIALDTRIGEPAPDAGEAELLLFSLDRSRAQFAWKAGGLDDAALRRTVGASSMTLAGLLKHLAWVEERYAIDVTGRPPAEPWRSVDWDATPGWDWTSAADDTAEQLYALWRETVARCREAWSAALAGGGLDEPARFTADDDGSSPALRRILVDLTDEYARHVGHADLLREAIDGLVGEDPPQA